ncbi:MAG TPA: hypothetical protein VGL71_14705 [Urbifossiella sp.]|jgi:hypothetical protein
MPRLHQHLFAFLTLFAFAAGPAIAAPRDELLRVAPTDAALLLLVQNARDHIQNLEQSPFAKWFPQTALGRQFLNGVDLKQARNAAAPIFSAFGIQPEELLADIFGDAVAFAYTPASNDDPKSERAVVLIRPRTPETLAKLIAKLNEIQTAGGEVKSIVSRKHRGEEYFERQKPGGSDFYCFRGGVFAFSGTEPDIQSVIDRDQLAGEKPPEAATKIAKLGVADSFIVALINPRPFDAEIKIKAARANGHEKLILERFQEVWQALDSAAIYLALNSEIEFGVSLQFQPNKLPAGAKYWLTGPRHNAAVWQAIPGNSMLAVAGQFKAAELIEALGSLAGPNPLKIAVEQFLGPVFGKDKLSQVLNVFGPQWAVWIEPPTAGSGFLPVGVAAIQIDRSGTKGKEAAREIARAIAFGFNTIRVAYNAGHADQIELVETEDGDAVITSLVNEKSFPPGFQPSYAFKAGYLLIATSPAPIKRFQEPKATSINNESTLARISGAAIRDYLLLHREKLAKFLAAAGHGEEKELLKQFEQLATLLELIDRVELFSTGDATSMRFAARIKLAKPLKK